MLSLSFQPGLIIKLEEKQVEGPQCDGEIFLFSSATACWSPCWGPFLSAISPSFLSSHLSFISCFLSLILPTSFLTSSFSPSFVPVHIDSCFGSDSPSFLPTFLHFFCFLYSQIWILPNDYIMKKIQESKAENIHHINPVLCFCPSLPSQWIPADFNLTRLLITGAGRLINCR